MADFDFESLKKKYEYFREPRAKLYVNDKELTGDTSLGLIDLDVEITSGYEASIATVLVAGSFNPSIRSFDVSKSKQYFFLGSTVRILMGYGTSVREVFRGFIARVHFIIPDTMSEDIPCIELTCMDVKGLMMANRHSKRLKAQYYSDAVKEVLDDNAAVSQRDSSGKSFVELNISNTPDKPEGGTGGGNTGAGGAGGGQQETDKRVEMVEESDYEFIVKAAKRYNFEFFAVGGTLYFIEAKKNTTPLITLSPFMGMKNMDVGYDITGLVKSVVVRNIDMAQGKYIGGKKKSNTKISLGNKAKALVDKQSMVYIDPTTESKDEAGYRASYLMDSIDYRLGSIVADYVGIPELIPGRFVTLKHFGQPLDNNFYITTVRHMMGNDQYITRIEGCANSIGD